MLHTHTHAHTLDRSRFSVVSTQNRVYSPMHLGCKLFSKGLTLTKKGLVFVLGSWEVTSESRNILPDWSAFIYLGP